LRSIDFGSWSDEPRIRTGIARLIGLSVASVGVAGRLPELVVGLSDRRWVHSFMTAEGQPEWTLFLPDGSCLTVERGSVILDVRNRRIRRSRRAQST
jgi:hypothetical protein